MKTRNILLLAGLLLYASNAAALSAAYNFHAQESAVEVMQEEVKLPPLNSGTVFRQNSDVPLIRLRGKEVLGDSLLGLDAGVLLKDSILTLIHWSWAQREWNECDAYTEIRHYSFPDMQLITSVNFPDWINSSLIIPTVDTTPLFYILNYESIWTECGNQHIGWEQRLYEYDLSGKLTHLDSLTLPITLNQALNRVALSLTHIGNNDFIFRDDSVIVRASITEKGNLIDTLFHIPLFPYQGELLINSAKNRIVFAHHHHHLFHIVDLETNAVKTVDFKDGVHYFRDRYVIRMGDWNRNPYYYVDAFAGENYFYLLFWGHTGQAFENHARQGWREVGEFSRVFEKTDKYEQSIPNIVERYDWNGNLMARYLLEGNPTRARIRDRDFWVDERNRQFFILAVDYQNFRRFSVSRLLSLMVYSFCQE